MRCTSALVASRGQMAKSFDVISEAKAMNYQFLKAQLVISMARNPPAPPPFYALTVPWEFVVQPLLYLVGYDCYQKRKKFHDTPSGEKAQEAAVKSLEQASEAAANAAAAEKRRRVFLLLEDKKAQEAAFKSLEQASVAAANEAAENEAALDRELKYARTITHFIQENDDDSAQQERWRVFVQRDTVSALNEVKQVHKKVDDVCEKLEDFQPDEESQKVSMLKKAEKKLDKDVLDKVSKQLDQLGEQAGRQHRELLAKLDGMFQQKQLSAPESDLLPGRLVKQSAPELERSTFDQDIRPSVSPQLRGVRGGVQARGFSARYSTGPWV